MSTVQPEDIRNICILGGNAVGKTQLAEALAYKCGATDRLGFVDQGNTIFDSDKEEIERKISITGAVARLNWKDKILNIIDTPGYADFVGQIPGPVQASEAVLLVIDAENGVDASTVRLWNLIKKQNKICLIFISRIDREQSNFDATLNAIKNRLTPNAAPATIPIGIGSEHKGVVDILTGRSEIDGAIKPEIPSEIKESFSRHQEKLLEAVAATDDALTEKYLAGEQLSDRQTNDAMHKALCEASIVPVFTGSAVKQIGLVSLLDFISERLPGPVALGRADTNKSFIAQVFKISSESHLGDVIYLRSFAGKLTSQDIVYDSKSGISQKAGQIYFPIGSKRINGEEIISGDIACLVKLKQVNIGDVLCTDKNKLMDMDIKEIHFPEPVVEVAVYAKNRGEEEKMANALNTLKKEDPLLQFSYSAETKEMVLRGMGTLQLEILVSHVHERFGAQIELKPPKIPYKETIKTKSEAQGKYKRQTGGHGQYGDCWIRLEPLERGKGFEFVDAIVGGAIPRNFIPSVEKGLVAAMEEGVIAGYPIIDVRAALFDGSYHEVDSSDIAFKIAAGMALRKAVQEAHPTIIEPIYEVTVIVPKDFVGSVVGDLNGRRGRILSITPLGPDIQEVKVHIPLAEIRNYAADLRSLTRGTGEFSKKFVFYEEALARTIQQLVSNYETQKEQAKTA